MADSTRTLSDERLLAEVHKLNAETFKLNVETRKLFAEANEMSHERTWYPVILMATAIGATAAFMRVFVS